MWPWWGRRGALMSPPARSRPSAAWGAISIPLGGAVDRTPLVRVDFTPGPTATVPLRRGRRRLGVGQLGIFLSGDHPLFHEQAGQWARIDRLLRGGCGGPVRLGW